SFFFSACLFSSFLFFGLSSWAKALKEGMANEESAIARIRNSAVWRASVRLKNRCCIRCTLLSVMARQALSDNFGIPIVRTRSSRLLARFTDKSPSQPVKVLGAPVSRALKILTGTRVGRFDVSESVREPHKSRQADAHLVI